jgi:hypothetical protein
MSEIVSSLGIVILPSLDVGAQLWNGTREYEFKGGEVSSFPMRE